MTHRGRPMLAAVLSPGAGDDRIGKRGAARDHAGAAPRCLFARRGRSPVAPSHKELPGDPEAGAALAREVCGRVTSWPRTRWSLRGWDHGSSTPPGIPRPPRRACASFCRPRMPDLMPSEEATDDLISCV